MPINLAYSSIDIDWEDKRHIEVNQHRNLSCKSKQVDGWFYRDSYWVPLFEVRNALEMVTEGFNDPISIFVFTISLVLQFRMDFLLLKDSQKQQETEP